MSVEPSHPDPPTITPPATPPNTTSTLVYGKGRIAPKRFVKSLTAKEVYLLAPDPSLVPRPLAFRKQTRNVSAPAALESGAAGESQVESRNEKNYEGMLPACHFRDRPRSHQHAILDTVARIVANGVDASEIAKDMDMEWNELTQYMASFGVSARDVPSILDEEIRLFYSSNPATLFSEDKLCNDTEGDLQTPKARTLEDTATDLWEVNSYEGTESTNSRIDYEGLQSWIEYQGDVFRDSPPAVVTQVNGTLTGSEGVYQDAQESQDETPSRGSRLKLSSNDDLTSCKDLAALELQLPSIFGLIVLSPLHVGLERANTDPGARKAPVPRLKRFFSSIPNAVWITLAVMAARMLGILLAEVHRIVLYY